MPTRLATWLTAAIAACLLTVVVVVHHSLRRETPGDETRATNGKQFSLGRAAPASIPEAGEARHSSPEPPLDKMIGEARRRVTALVGRAAVARFHEANVADPEQRIVCGTVSLRVDEDSTLIVRYIAFGGSGIVVIDDASPAFVEIHASACGGA